MSQRIFKKLFSMKKEVLAIIFLSGVLLLVIAMPTGKKTSNAASFSEEEGEWDDYERRLGKELSGILQQMEGVGEVEVMLTLTREEEKQDFFYTKNEVPGVQGVLVVAQGGENPMVKQKILEAVKALFQIESHKISIVKKKP